MTHQQDPTDILTWLRDKPELLEKLRRMRQIEEDEQCTDIDRIELEMLELVKSMGAESFGRCVQAKEARAFEAEKGQGGGRIHGKKTEIFQFEGQATVYDAARGGPCHRCLFPEMPAPGTVPNCEEAGVFGALCGLVGSMQAMEAIKHLAGIGESLAGRLLVFDALAMDFRTLRLKKNPGCPLCGEQPEILNLIPGRYEFNCETAEAMPGQEEEAPWEIGVNEAGEWLRAGDAPYLLDVREPYEAAICAIGGAVNIPMREVPERLDALPKDRPVLVYCHHGHRSMNVVKFLRERGFERATNLRGGFTGGRRRRSRGWRGIRPAGRLENPNYLSSKSETKSIKGWRAPRRARS